MLDVTVLKILIFEAIAMSSKKPVIYSKFVAMYIASINVNYIIAVTTLWLL